MAQAPAIELVNRALLSIGVPVVDTLVGGELEGQKALALLNRGGQALMSMRGAFGEGWPDANKRYSFQTEAGRSFYPLPGDFATIIPGTVWDSGDGWQAIGSLTPTEDNVLRYGVGGNTAVGTLFRQIEQDGHIGLSLWPEPAAGATVRVEYISRSWVRESAGVTPTLERVTRDDHVPIFNDHLVELDVAWRFKRANADSYDVELAEFEEERQRQFAQALPPRVIEFGGDRFDRSVDDRLAAGAVGTGEDRVEVREVIIDPTAGAEAQTRVALRGGEVRGQFIGTRDFTRADFGAAHYGNVIPVPTFSGERYIGFSLNFDPDEISPSDLFNQIGAFGEIGRYDDGGQTYRIWASNVPLSDAWSGVEVTIR